MISKACAMAVSAGVVRGWFEHTRIGNTRGQKMQCRPNGKCKTWKRDPRRFKLPVKYGLKECFYFDSEYPASHSEWVHPEWEEAKGERNKALADPVFKALLTGWAQAKDDSHLPIMADRAEELGFLLLARLLRAGFLPVD